ncbi:VOC family protein [Streptomyces sp. SID13031]|uniref:VOC family protein n=1 Tax=Streptomyces sp. SID13031 TaxID=2706046 RepID=UPI0013CCDF5F|nr:VOC family protein [Streptomyces sp. SID13031]NEA35785.1 VOC family protein [Streptomyces sp. SID13031]
MAKSEFEQVDGVEDWRVLDASTSAWFAAPSLTTGAALVGRIAELTGDSGLPDVDLRVGGVRVRIGVPDSPSPADVALARAISAAARELGLTADPAALQTLRLVIDAADGASVRSFWQAALAYEPTADNGLADPLRRDPAISFRELAEPRPLRNRIHVDVSRVREAVEVVKAAVGGDGYGPWQFTRADPEGNELDLVPGPELSDGPEAADWWAMFGAMVFYPTASAEQASRLAAAVAGLADDAARPLLIDLRPDGVTIDSGKDEWENDPASFAELAVRIQTAAHDLGLSADPARLRFVQFGLDAVDITAVRAFWTTVLGYQHDPRTGLTDICDPRRLNPVLFFQPMDAADEERRRQRNRLHFELAVPAEQLQSRLDAAVAAGGRLLAAETPAHRTITDPEGNELTIVTPIPTSI